MTSVIESADMAAKGMHPLKAEGPQGRENPETSVTWVELVPSFRLLPFLVPIFA